MNFDLKFNPSARSQKAPFSAFFCQLIKVSETVCWMLKTTFTVFIAILIKSPLETDCTVIAILDFVLKYYSMRRDQISLCFLFVVKESRVVLIGGR